MSTPVSDSEWKKMRKRWAASKIRSKYALTENEIHYMQDRGLDLVRQHAGDFVRQRIGPAAPRNDGKQTPTKGHPVFVAQHATGTCCRECLEKWHKIPRGKALTESQMKYVVEVVMRWLTEESANAPVVTKKPTPPRPPRDY